MLFGSHTFLGCNVDVSYQKWLQSHKDIRLQETLEAKRQTENFIDMVSHEMRNPLSAILQSSDSITATIDEAVRSGSNNSGIRLDDADVCSVSESAATITTCAQHQKRIVDDILTLSKLDASLLVVSMDEVDPIATVKHALQLHQQEFKSAKVTGSVTIDSSYYKLHIQRVFLDPSRLLQVLINLLTNAIKL
jgi:signal transduction histidine kinase